MVQVFGGRELNPHQGRILFGFIPFFEGAGDTKRLSFSSAVTAVPKCGPRVGLPWDLGLQCRWDATGMHQAHWAL